MNRRYWPGAAVVAALLAVPAAAPAAGFKYGVTSAEVSSSSAIVWTRAPKTGRVTVLVARNKRFSKGVRRRKVRAKASDDRTVRFKLRKLRSGTRYYYRFRQGKRRSAVGRFLTAPRANRRKTFTFSFSGDADAQPERGETTPFYNRFQVYRSMAREGNAFNINLGDTIYSDSEVGARVVNGEFEPAFVARTAKQKWAKYKQNLALANLRRVRSNTSMFNHWDDHEFINDFSRPENGGTIFGAGARAFQDYMPVKRTNSTGIYRKVRWGANAELFFLDARSFRSAKVSSTEVCDNPDTDNPDLAPAVPQRIRDVFAALYPPFARPVSAACKAALYDPSKTLLGARQLERFTRDVKRSKARWKIVINEVPMQQFYVLPYDRWEGYGAERDRVLRTLASKRNTVVLTTDVHATLYNDVRYRTFEGDGPRNSGVPELTTGPVATMTYDREVDDAVGREGTGELARRLFFKQPPPNGVGMRCAVTDTYSYTQVRVSRTSLTLRPKDLNGRQLREPGENDEPGPACGPYKLQAR